MLSSLNTPTADLNLLDPDHDLDLVALLASAESDSDLENAMRITRNRMRGRRGGAIKRSTRRTAAVRSLVPAPAAIFRA